MAVPLLTPKEGVCHIDPQLITFVSVDYPPEGVIDVSLARPLDRCSKYFGQTEESLHATSEVSLSTSDQVDLTDHINIREIISSEGEVLNPELFFPATAKEEEKFDLTNTTEENQ
jgi:hypothetical protein